MRKFINFCKKPLFIASSVIFGLFLAMLIVVCALPRGNKYKYEGRILFESVAMELEFKNGKIYADSSSMNIMPDTQNVPECSDYKIENGILYEIENGKTVKIGKINAFKIVIDVEDLLAESKSEFPDGGIVVDETTGKKMTYEQLVMMLKMFMGDKIELECAMNIALHTTAIVFVSVFGTVALACLIIFVLDKKGVIKHKDETEPALVEVETISSSLPEDEAVIPVEGNALEPAIKKTRVSAKKKSAVKTAATKTATKQTSAKAATKTADKAVPKKAVPSKAKTTKTK